MDIITTLPEIVIETILCCLPIEEAVRTSILSREWRYKWTKIPKLVFDRSTMIEITKSCDMASEKDIRCKIFYAIHQVLLLHQGPIHEFFLSVYADNTYFEVDQIILHLSRNHVLKKLTLDFLEHDSYKLPLSIFSLQHLTELEIDSCDLYHESNFNGFNSLTSLSLKSVMTTKKSLLHLLSNCPSLKSLCLLIHPDDFLGDPCPNIMELCKCLPRIEHLTISGDIIPLLVLVLDPQELSTSLIHLKHLCISYLRFDDGCGLTFISAMMKCSHKLEKIKLEIYRYDSGDKVESVKLEEYSDVWLEHLNELEIRDIRNYKLHLDLVKFILVRSPILKKVKLVFYEVDKNKELEMTKILLSTPRASPVEIFVENCYEGSDDEDDDGDNANGDD